MGCRPSRASMGRVGDSSWGYNKHFIKEHKEKKLKNKRSGRGERRKVPVYNDFSSTSKTYTNLNSKSSKITVRLSTDGSMLEIEQFDIDLNACVDRYLQNFTALTKQVRLPYLSCQPNSNKSHFIQRCFSAPQLSIVSVSPHACKRDINRQINEIKLHSTKGTVLSKPKKSNSVHEKGFQTNVHVNFNRKTFESDPRPYISERYHQAMPTHYWKHVSVETCDVSEAVSVCDQKHDVSGSNNNQTVCTDYKKCASVERCKVIQNTTYTRQSNAEPPELMCKNYEKQSSYYTCICDGEGSVLDFEKNRHILEHDKLSSRKKQNFNNNKHNKSTPLERSMLHHIGLYQHCQRYLTDSSCCCFNKGAPIDNEGRDSGVHKRLYAKEQRQCSQCDFKSDMDLSKVTIGTSVNSTTPFNESDPQKNRIFDLCDCGDSSEKCRSMKCEVIQNTRFKTAQNARNLVVDKQSNIRENAVYGRYTGVHVMTDTLPPQNQFRNKDSDSKRHPLSNINCKRRNPRLPGGENPPPCYRGKENGRDAERLSSDNIISASKKANLKENLVAVETTDKLSDLAGGNHYESGVPADFVFLIQTNSSNGRLDELPDLTNNNLVEESEEYNIQTGYKTGKYSTYGEVEDELSPDIEEIFDESFEQRFDLAACTYGVLTVPTADDIRYDADGSELSSSDFADEDYLDALETTCV